MLIGVGANDRGQLGGSPKDAQGSRRIIDEQTPREGSYEVQARGDISCVWQRASKRLRCTGDNRASAISDSDAPQVLGLANAPSDLGFDGEAIDEVALGAQSLCVRLAPSQRLRCRGDNSYGQLVDGTTSSRASSDWVLIEDEAARPRSLLGE